ncbi:MAG: hypothetical protein ACJAUB_002801 [Cryomorphaceae bacterium]|jgi:hypothetical protein
MIKFFRHIRRQMIKENSVSKYLIYAISEIVLVVIGILIALQLNLWKEERNLRNQEIVTLEQLRGEFRDNLKQLDEKISMRDAMINSAYQLMAYHDDHSRIIADSVEIYLARTTVSPTFDPITNDLISSGRLYLITNLELRQKLSRWTSELVQVTEEEKSWIGINRDRYVPHLMSTYPTRNINARKWSGLDVVHTLLLDKDRKTIVNIGRSNTEPDLERFFADPELENLLSSVLSSVLFANEQSLSLRKSILDILDMIDKGLEK